MVDADGHADDEGIGPHGDKAVIRGESLANLILEAPERFANGDRQVAQESLGAVKAILDYALSSEAEALEAVGKYLGPILGQSPSKVTRSKGGKKRKRNGASSSDVLWSPTPLDSMTVDNLNEDQIWSQIELKNERITNLLKAAMVDNEDGQEEEEMKQMMQEEEEEERQALDEVEKKRQRKGLSVPQDDADDDEEDDLGAMRKEKIVHSLKELSDADLRSLGLDPSRRAELEKLEEMDDEALESEEEEENLGYPGASDLSDDDEMQGKVVIEPLRTEEQQRKRQAQLVAEERQRMRKQREIKKALGIEDDDDEDEDEDDEDDEEEEEEEDDSDDGDDAEAGNLIEDSDGSASVSEDSEEEEGKPQTERKRFSSLLDNLDAIKPNKKWKTHPTLDDDFFSIDQFNRDTDDYGDEGISLGDDVDLFRPIEEEEEEPILYSDFFAPPPGESSVRGGPPQASEASIALSATQKPSADNLEKKTSVRFHEEVSVRHIKPRKGDDMEITPELLKAMQNGGASDDDEGEDEDSEEMSEEDLSGEEDEADAEEVEEEEDAELDTVDDNEEEEDMEVDASDDEKSDGEDEEELDSIDGEGIETAHRVAGDLFADEEEDNVESVGAGKQLSAHQKRLEKLQQEIARLERENVSKKDWTLMGETGSRARPENSLLAEPLDFENNNRAKPVITQETTSTLEELIKKRILESSFDNVERRANVQAFDFLPSKMLELSDTKSSKSLDQVYEDEVGMGSGVSHGEKMDKQLEQDHQEITRLYDELEYKLDALSNAHFTPKAPKATIQTISNTPTITMEESLPSTSNYASQLAPEEVYDAGRHNAALQGDRSEMTPEEKKRLQRQLRGDKKARNERIDSIKKNVEINKQAFAKNRGGRFVGSGKKGSRNDAIEKQDALSKLLGNKGVSVVGKGNEDKKRRQDTTSLNASHYKL